MTIYVVTSGEYSDYRINSMFSTKELAEKHIEKMKLEECPDCGEIEIWEVDQQASAEIRSVWRCGILLDDGDIREAAHERKQLLPPFRGKVIQFGARVPAYQQRPIARVESGISAEHCLKLAAEARQKWLRGEAFETKDLEYTA